MGDTSACAATKYPIPKLKEIIKNKIKPKTNQRKLSLAQVIDLV
jgi:hypothetical protein